MGIIIRQSIKSSAVTIVSAALGALVTVLLMYLLPKTDYGTYTLIISYGTIISEIILLITPTVYFMYSKKFQKKNQSQEAGFNRHILKPSLALLILFQLGLVLFQYIIRPRIDLNPNGFFNFLDENLVTFSLLVTSLILYTFSTTILEANQKSTLSSISKNLMPRLFNLSVILLLLVKLISYKQAIILLLFQYSIGAFIAMLLIIHFQLFPLKNPTKISKEESSSIQLYRLSHIGFVLINLIAVQSIALIYTLVFKNQAATYAVFNVAIYLASFMSIPLDQLSRTSLSIISQNMRESKWSELQDMYKRANLNLFHLGTAMCIALIMGLPLIIDITGNEKYVFLLVIAPYFLIGKWMDVSTGFNTQLIIASPKYLNILWISAISLGVLFLCYYFLIPMMGDQGVAAAVCLWYFIYNLIKILFVQKEFGLKPYYGRVNLQSLAVGVPLLVFSVWSLSFSWNPWISAIIGFFIALIYIITVNKLGLSVDMQLLISRLRGMISKD